MSTETTDLEEKKPRRPGRPEGSKTSRSAKRLQRARKVLELAAKQMPRHGIATVVGCSERTVERELARYRKVFKELDHVDGYRRHRREILTAAESQLIQSMLSPGKLAKASVNNLAYAYRQVHDSRRLEEGLSTSNTASTVRFTRVDITKHSDSD